MNSDDNKQDDIESVPGFSWVNSWWQSAKEKSSSALEFMKKDLTEFSQVVKEDAVSAISTTSTILKEKLNVDSDESVAGRARIGLTTLVHSVSGAFYPINEPQESEALLIRNSQPIPLDNWDAELRKIKIEHGTFCHEPEGPPELYESWLESFHLQSHSDEVSQIMANNPETRQIYSKLVPAAISNIEFWQRYFYRVHQLKEKEARRAELVKRVNVEKIEDLAWEDDDETALCHKDENVSPQKDVSVVTKSPVNDDSRNVESLVRNKDLGSTEKPLMKELQSSKIENVDEKTTTSSNSSLAASSEKDGHTGDEWEKDFEAEITDFIEKEPEAQIEEPKILQVCT